MKKILKINLTGNQVPCIMDLMSEIYDQLRKAIKAISKSRYQLWQETDIDQAQLARFMSGISGLSVESTERLADALGLEIVIQPKRTAKSPKKRTVKHGKCDK